MSPIRSTKTNRERGILIVDDEEQNLDLLEAILLPEGYRLQRASNGFEAVRNAAGAKPDLVIMDVRMPKKDGFEACREIKSLNNHFIPVILLTGLSDTESQVRGFDAGADEYLIKPPRKAELLARVRAMLRIRDLHDELVRSNREKERVNRELLAAQQTIQNDLARIGSIQRSFLPSRFPYHPEIGFGHFYGPCELAGGDYFDIIEVGRDKWGLLVADVTGHGAPAAVVMAITHTLMHSFTNSFNFPSTALKVANEKLNAHLAPTFYVTMFYGVLNLHTMKLRYASAGHEPMMLYRASENRVISLATQYGFPLKLTESDDYDEREIQIEPSDKIVLFTDGLVERRSPEGEFFSPERLEEMVLKHHALPAQTFVDSVIEEANRFHPQQPFQDDVTMFVIERLASARIHKHPAGYGLGASNSISPSAGANEGSPSK